MADVQFKSGKSLLVVGSLAFDCIETPNGSVDDALGGSATYFSYAASFFLAPRLVSVVGADFPQQHRELLARRGVDLAGLQTKSGKTFRWKGRYHQDMNTRDTIEVHLNVLSDFDPKVPEPFRDSSYIFLANSTPAVQLNVLDQVRQPEAVWADTMDLWITTQSQELLQLLPRLDGLFLNDSEAHLLTGESNLVRAGRAVLSLGPKYVILKKGEHGALLFSKKGIWTLPAFPTEQVVDPTGAGDTFAGGILGYLSTVKDDSLAHIRRAMAYGTVIASFTVEDFSLKRLLALDREEIENRLEIYRAMLGF
jgi:sugar/nucleoside kinase (ribokinase family)